LIVNAVACWVRNREQENFLVKTSEKYAEVIFFGGIVYLYFS
jgi:hypothetical protein